jgi:hypothetical protein
VGVRTAVEPDKSVGTELVLLTSLPFVRVFSGIV